MITLKVLHPYFTFSRRTFEKKDYGPISILKIELVNDRLDTFSWHFGGALFPKKNCEK